MLCCHDPNKHRRRQTIVTTGMLVSSFLALTLHHDPQWALYSSLVTNMLWLWED